jgi:hypothetical protein
MNRNRAIIFVAIATTLCATVLLFASKSGPIWLRAIVGIPFALLLPGQAAMLFVDPDGQLGGFEWFTLSVSVSIATTSLLAMGLAASVGLTTLGVVTAITLVTLLTLLGAGARAGALPVRGQQPARRNSLQRMTYAAVALLTCAGLVLALSIPTAPVGHSAQVVQLWGLPDKTAGGLRIGAANIDATSRHYVLRIEQGGRLISVQDVDMPAGSERLFVVKKSATWTNSSPVTAVLADVSGKVTPRTVSVWTIE